MAQPNAAALYYLIASEFTGDGLGIIGFLKLKDVLTYRFTYDLKCNSMKSVVSMAMEHDKQIKLGNKTKEISYQTPK